MKTPVYRLDQAIVVLETQLDSKLEGNPLVDDPKCYEGPHSAANLVRWAADELWALRKDLFREEPFSDLPAGLKYAHAQGLATS